jgi:hypothetical protein
VRKPQRPTLAAGCWLIGQLAWDLFAVVGLPASPNVADAAVAVVAICETCDTRGASGAVHEHRLTRAQVAKFR